MAASNWAVPPAINNRRCLARTARSHGMAKNTYGTGCFMLMNIGDEPLTSKCKLLTTVACSVDQQREYALEGSVFIAGAAVQWLRDGLGIIESSSEVESLAASVPDSDGVYMVPAFAGSAHRIGIPMLEARSSVSRAVRTRAHIARAALEGIAFQVADVLDAMKQDAGIPIEELRVDGGASANDLLMQFQADILQVPVVRPKVIETTALGAAFLAGLAVGFWSEHRRDVEVWQTERVFQPAMPDDEVARATRSMGRSPQACRAWETSMTSHQAYESKSLRLDDCDSGRRPGILSSSGAERPGSALRWTPPAAGWMCCCSNSPTSAKEPPAAAPNWFTAASGICVRGTSRWFATRCRNGRSCETTRRTWFTTCRS